MENNGANLHVKSYVVDATTQKLDKIILSDGTEIAADGIVIGTLSLGDIELQIPAEAGAVTVSNVTIKNNGTTLGKADLKITFTE